MEKIIFAIIALNIVASIYASRKKKKLAQQALENNPSRSTLASSLNNLTTRSTHRADGLLPQKPRQDRNINQKAQSTGRNILSEMAKEFGFSLEQDTPVLPEPIVPNITAREKLKVERVMSGTQMETRFETPVSKKKLPKPKVEEYATQPVEVSEGYNSHLRNAQSLRQAFIIKTILDPPLSRAGHKANRAFPQN